MLVLLSTAFILSILSCVAGQLYLHKFSFFYTEEGEINSIKTCTFNTLIFRLALLDPHRQLAPGPFAFPLWFSPSNLILLAQGHCQWTGWWAGLTLQLPIFGLFPISDSWAGSIVAVGEETQGQRGQHVRWFEGEGICVLVEGI